MKKSLFVLIAALLCLVGCGSQDATDRTETVATVSGVDVICSGPNQSNGAGIATGTTLSGIPDASIRFFSRELGTGGEGFTTWQDLQLRAYTAHPNSHGSALALGKALQRAGRRVAILELFKGSTFIKQWLPGTGNHDDLMLWTDNALALLRAEFPDETEFRFWVKTNQGEAEARSFEATVLLWSSRHTIIYGTIVDKIHERFPDAPVRSLISATRLHIAGSTNPGEPAGATLLNDQQRQAAEEIGGLFVDQEGLPDDGGGVHLNEDGYNELGEREAAAVLSQ